MRTVIVVVFMLLAVALVGGCSSTARVSSRYVQDVDKVALVNAVARKRGVEVIWVHPPQKKVSDAVSRPENLAQQ